MITTEELAMFQEQGFLHVPGVLAGGHLCAIQSAFDRVWEQEGTPVDQHKLLRHPEFIDLIEHPPILERHRAIFGSQVQLLQYDLLRQGPRSHSPERAWHRDFMFPGNYPLSVNTILYLDHITEDAGPTRVVPGSHRGAESPSREQIHQVLPDETPVYAAAGDAVFINSAIWHTGGRNGGEGLRRGIYLYYGYWWLKRYESERTLP